MVVIVHILFIKRILIYLFFIHFRTSPILRKLFNSSIAPFFQGGVRSLVVGLFFQKMKRLGQEHRTELCPCFNHKSLREASRLLKTFASEKKTTSSSEKQENN